MKKKILFVDDEPNILEALERMLFPMQREWKISFANSGNEALDFMEKDTFDVMVTDMRMPGMDGAELLSKVKAKYPETIRFILSGQSDKETTYRSLDLAHQFMAKPCDAKALKVNVDSAFVLRDLLESEDLKGMISQTDSLPAIPNMFAALMDELQSEDASVKTVGEIIESDIGMTAKILQLVNSAFFGLGQEVASATQAVSLLGLDTVKALVLVSGVFSKADGKNLPSGFSLENLWRHSMAVGTWAEAIAKSESADKTLIKDAYTAGLLHDAGLLLMAVNFYEDYKHVLDYAFVNDVPLVDAEREVLGCTHAEVGAYLLGIWGLPNPIVQAVAFHHTPLACPSAGFSPLVAVHAANALDREANGSGGDWGNFKVDSEYLEKVGCLDKLEGWRALGPKSED